MKILHIHYIVDKIWEEGDDFFFKDIYACGLIFN
jgi:hypothetical protein